MFVNVSCILDFDNTINEFIYDVLDLFDVIHYDPYVMNIDLIQYSKFYPNPSGNKHTEICKRAFVSWHIIRFPFSSPNFML